MSASKDEPRRPHADLAVVISRSTQFMKKRFGHAPWPGAKVGDIYECNMITSRTVIVLGYTIYAYQVHQCDFRIFYISNQSLILKKWLRSTFQGAAFSMS